METWQETLRRIAEQLRAAGNGFDADHLLQTINDIEESARKFYRADGTIELMESPEAVTEARKRAAAAITVLRDRLFTALTYIGDGIGANEVHAPVEFTDDLICRSVEVVRATDEFDHTKRNYPGWEIHAEERRAALVGPRSAPPQSGEAKP